jgi:hypothetical protein
MALLGALAFVMAAALAWRGLYRMRRGLRDSASLELVRGIRALVTGAALAVLALALFTGSAACSPSPPSSSRKSSTRRVCCC